MRKVLIFRSDILPFSETFIQAQANALETFRPQLIGLSPIPHSLELSPSPILLVCDNSPRSRIRRAVYQSTGFAPAFHRAAQRTNADIIHAHFAPDGVAALPLSRSLKLPLLVTLHGYDVTRADVYARSTLGDQLYLMRRNTLWSKAALFICVSTFIRESALQMGFPPNKLRVHHIGVDTEFFSPAPDGHKREDNVLFVGRLVEKKGCTHLIKAMALVQRRHPSAQLIVIGDGPDRLSLQREALKLKLLCRFLGPQPRHVIRDWLWSTRVFCAPSVTARNGDSEGFGMVFAEAQAVGTPVVSFYHGGIPEVVCSGQTGLLAQEGDYVSLADHICRFLEDKTYWEETSHRAMRWTRERFDLRRQTRQLEDVYLEVLGAVQGWS
jgi:colanic acid/amylovoran biosynthesis glycosyltransferase